MKVPISWLEEYVKVDMKLDDLMWKMTEIGLTTETYEKKGKEIILDVEVTPNRPDWLSIIGIAREVGAIQKNTVKPPKTPKLPQKEEDLPIKININHKLCPRYTAITIAGVTVKDSPDWMQNYLKLMDLRPINNLVDITNFVMFELGVPIHVFDYDKIKDQNIRMQMAKGGEKFTSVDGIEYELPEDAIIIKDKDRVIDLCGIKGGENTGITEDTKNIMIHLPIYTPEMIRKTSQKMKLASEASYIYERGAHAGGTLDSLNRVVDLVIKHAGGEIASDIIDIKQKQFIPNRLVLHKDKLDKILGVEIKNNNVVKLLKRLNFRPESRGNTIVCTIPTYRQDVNIEEDLIEEVARMYGYNEFPRTLPDTQFRIEDIPLKYDYQFELELKNLMTKGGYDEVNTLSLISEELIRKCNLQIDSHIKLQNPVSREYEYLRFSLIPNLIRAVKLNSDVEYIKLFEFGKVFSGPVDTREEFYKIAAISNQDNFREIKGVVDLVLDFYKIDNYQIKKSKVEHGIWHPHRSAVLEKNNIYIGTYGYINPKNTNKFGIEEDVFGFEFDVQALKKLQKEISFEPLSKYPPHIEDITIQTDTDIADVITSIRETSSVIRNVELKDVYNNKYTFRITYLHKGKTLEDKDIEKLRKKITKNLKKIKVKIDL